MRYHHTSWNDVDRALEAFRYARRSLIVVMLIALPFAAWETATSHSTTARQDTIQAQPGQHAVPVKAVHPAKGGEGEMLPLSARI